MEKMISYDELVSIMEYIRQEYYARSKQVAQFIDDIKEHYGETRGGTDGR